MKRSAVLLEFYVRKQRDYKEGIDSTNRNNEAVLRKNIKINIKGSLNTIKDKDRKQNIKKLKEKTKHSSVNSWKWIGKWSKSLLGEWPQYSLQTWIFTCFKEQNEFIWAVE